MSQTDVSPATPLRDHADALDRSLADLVGLGRLWARHGLRLGAQSLETASRSLEVTGRFLETLRTELEDEPPTSESAPTA